jgi:hypothetical protein
MLISWIIAQRQMSFIEDKDPEIAKDFPENVFN